MFCFPWSTIFAPFSPKEALFLLKHLKNKKLIPFTSLKRYQFKIVYVKTGYIEKTGDYQFKLKAASSGVLALIIIFVSFIKNRKL